MEFDKSKVYTSLNADEVKIKSKGFFADTLQDLEDCVKNETGLFTLRSINNKDFSHRFSTNKIDTWLLFYLVEEPKEEKYKPYTSDAELIEDFKNRVSSFAYECEFIPSIWVKEKSNSDKYLITGFIKDDSNAYCVLIGTCFVSLSVLLESYTYLDGTPCGKKVK
jgi:hypothetical protein